MSVGDWIKLVSGIISLLPKILDIIKAVAEMFPKKENETEEQAKERQKARKNAANARIRVALKGSLGREPTEDEIVWARDTAHKMGKIIKSRRRVGKARA